MCTTSSLYSSARSASTSIWSAVRPPNGILIRIIPGASHTVSGPLVTPFEGKCSGFVPVPSFRWPFVVSLSVDPAPEPGLREHLLVDLALTPELDLAVERVDFGGELSRYPLSQSCLPAHITPRCCPSAPQSHQLPTIASAGSDVGPVRCTSDRRPTTSPTTIVPGVPSVGSISAAPSSSSRPCHVRMWGVPAARTIAAGVS